jgi:hypothetical protein
MVLLSKRVFEEGKREKGTRGQGDKGTTRQGDKEIKGQFFLPHLPYLPHLPHLPHLLISLISLISPSRFLPLLLLRLFID